MATPPLKHDPTTGTARAAVAQPQSPASPSASVPSDTAHDGRGAEPDDAPVILVAATDPPLRACIVAALEHQLYRIVEAVDGTAALASIRRAEPDVIVLDSQLADEDAVDVCRRVRERSDACILVLADWDAEEHKILALTIGADDVLDKPFGSRELAARVRSLLRRPRRDTSSAASLAGDSMDRPAPATGAGGAPSSGADAPRPDGPSISAVLPAYNEEALIEEAVRRVAAVLARLTADHEIIVVNDGSRDRTGEVLAGLQAAEPDLRLRVVTHDTNRGYGAALASGFDAARKDLIFFTDGDEQFDVSELAGFLPEMDPQTDLVIGWRFKRADPFMRLVNAWGWKLLVNGLFGYTARDIDCAFKLFRRTVWESLTVRARGATFSAELLVKARRLGFRVKEMPVSHFPRTAGRATGARLDVIARAFAELFQLWRNLDRELTEDPRTSRLRALRDAAGAPHAA